jgi:hypothetical protein
MNIYNIFHKTYKYIITPFFYIWKERSAVIYDSGPVDQYQREMKSLLERPIRSLATSMAAGKSVRAADVVQELEKVQMEYEQEIRAEIGRRIEQSFIRDPKRLREIVQQIQQNMRKRRELTSEIQRKIGPDVQTKIEASARLADLIHKVRGWQGPLSLGDLRNRMQESLLQDRVTNEQRLETEKSDQQLRQAEAEQEKLLQQQIAKQEQEKAKRKQQQDQQEREREERERAENIRKQEDNLAHKQAANLFAQTMLFYFVLERLERKLQENEATGQKVQQQLKENEILHENLQQQLQKNHKECELHREQLKERLDKDPEGGGKIRHCHQELKEIKKERKQLKMKLKRNGENTQALQQQLRENKEKRKQLQQKLYQTPELQRLRENTQGRKQCRKQLRETKFNHQKLQQQWEKNQAERIQLRKWQHELRRDPANLQKLNGQLKEFYPDYPHSLHRENRGNAHTEKHPHDFHRNLDKVKNADHDRYETYYPTQFRSRDHMLDLLER